MNNLKIKTNNLDARIASVFFNGCEISHDIVGLTLKLHGGKVPSVMLEYPINNIEFDGNVDLLKNINKNKE